MVTTAGAKLLFEGGLDARPTECVIRAHCQTRVFKLPNKHISAAHPLRPAILVEQPNARATFVSDLADYFRNRTPFQHFSNSGVLRFKVSEAISKYSAGSTTDWVPLFVVIEQEIPCEERLATGTCYIVDQQYVGGYGGKESIIAFKVDDGPWPKLGKKDSRFANLVVATIKIVWGEKELTREIIDSSCFLDKLNRAVHATSMSFHGNLISSSPITGAELADKLCELRKLFLALRNWHGKNREHIDVLCDALRLESIETDQGRRAWYLSLFEAASEVLPGERRDRIRRCHSDCRNSIAHLKPNTKVDMEQFRQLQSDVIFQLRELILSA